MLAPANERAPGATFALADLGFVDFESANKRLGIDAGPYAYACSADAIIMSYAIADGPVQRIAVDAFPATLCWDDVPEDFKAFHARVQAGQAHWAAWNAAFDKAIWNYAAVDFPLLEAHQIIDVMVQAVTSGLAPDLDTAAKQSRSQHKDDSGTEWIKLFCTPKSIGTPQTHPEEWRKFGTYADQDVGTMRSIFLGTRQLPLAEWREYWAMEAVNQRGVGVDLAMTSHAAKLAAEDKQRSKVEMQALTGGQVKSVDHVKLIVTWLLQHLPAEGVELLTKREEETNEDGVVTRAAKFSLTRPRIEKLIVFCQAVMSDATTSQLTINALAPVLRVLQLRLYGGSKTPAKFAKINLQQIDGVVRGQYVFNGAAQTGRASSRGVQIQNLARDAMEAEHELIEAILNKCTYDELAAIGNNDPVARKLALLIRPAFVPQGDNVFVWSDLSQIESRLTAWLSGDDPGALERLKIFSDVDADPSVPDIYVRTAAKLSRVPVEMVTKPMRQRGKVTELAAGFGGGANALQNMATAYGMYLTDADAKETISKWRADNQWCVKFWGEFDGSGGRGLWGAVNLALRSPKQTFYAGRVAYTYLPGYLGGSLICTLPSGRCLTYRDIRYESVADVDDDGEPIGTRSTHLRCSRGYGRVKLWHGIFCENAVQATAADFLRGTLRRLEDGNYFVRLHSHDEILLECSPYVAHDIAASLRQVMQQGFTWSQGLPIMSEETISYYYSKNEKAYGL